jgi:hypothetical protein
LGPSPNGGNTVFKALSWQKLPDVLATCLGLILKVGGKPMFRASQNRVLAVCVVILAVGVIALWVNSSRVLGHAEQEAKLAGGPHYSVVMTEGHNLLVTDNGATSSTSTRLTRTRRLAPR